MALQKHVPSGDAPSQNMKALSLSIKGSDKAELANPGSSSEKPGSSSSKNDFDVDLREVYFLIMHFLSAGPCHRTYGQFWNELLEHQLLPRRYHAWYSRSGERSGDENDDGLSLPLSYNKLVERYPHAEKDHLVKLLKQLMLSAAAPSEGAGGGERYTAASVPTLLGTGSFSLLQCSQTKENNITKSLPAYFRWPHKRADQMRGLGLREIGGGFSRHHRAPSIRAASYAIASPSTMVHKMQNIKKLRGHLNAVYCAIFDRSGRYVITGSDDRLVKIWAMETAYCLASCRGHEGDITDLAVSSNNALVASASNDCVIRVWRLADGLPISILRGHTKAVTAIAFSPRPGASYHLLSSSDDGTCRIWDARHSHFSPRIYVAAPPESKPGAVKNNGPSSSASQETLQIFCCAFNANGTVFVTGSSDTCARVWNACKSNADESAPNHEIDCLSGHENDVNYVQFSGCSVSSRFSMGEASKEENILKSKNSWLNHDNIVTCSRDGSAIIWIPKSRKSHGKVGKWTRSYHLKVPPPPMPPQAPRGGPRQRILPTPRGVNMIVWSLDNRFVLAAIMDCRICVWNAVDGDLVHSLTGHTESTYVLDVHPFNPRIAMSAGYDGKTIVWDIWEGKPIRTYQIGQFKLVDGKFSPDGTSIILSDDVGQLYVLSTGQGESQKDAKYDQFFLGDYRPLTQDTHGNVLDQETQLAPHRRNMQDLLCDASMIPYPEPYQSTFQQRRLGALGREWRPSAVRFAAGPDISLDQTYQMLPVVDLDVLIDPLPQFLDAMDWEPPEVEVLSDDTDSEYNVTDECSSGGEKGGLGSNSSDFAEYSGEDSGGEGDQIDGLRRSRRKKHKAEITMTSSGRRIKRRNVDESSEHSLRDNRSRKSRKGKKIRRKKKSSSSKSSRPQRAAALNAMSMFSRITGSGADRETEDGSEDDLSESASTLQDSNVSSEESDDLLQNKQQDRSKGKEVLLDNYEDLPHEFSESNANVGSKMRLVLKFPVRDSRKPVSPECIEIKYDKKSDLVGTSGKSKEEIDEANQNYLQDPGSFADLNRSRVEKSKRTEHDKVESNLQLLEGYDQTIKWGGSKARSSKRLKTGEVEPLLETACAESCSFVHGGVESDKDANHLILKKECQGTETSSDTQRLGSQIDERVHTVHNHVVNVNDIPADTEVAANSEELSTFPKQLDHDELPSEHRNLPSSSTPFIRGLENCPELKETFVPLSTKLRIRTRRIPRDDDDGSNVDAMSSREGGRNGACSELLESPDTKDNLTSRLPGDNGNSRCSSDHQDQNSRVESERHLDGTSRSLLPDSQKSNSRDKMCTVVYRRTKSSRSRSNPKEDSESAEPSTSTAADHSIVTGVGVPEAVANGPRRTRSMAMTGTARNGLDLQNATDLREEHDGTIATPVGIHSSPFNRYTERPSEERRSGSRVAVGLRSTRNRRSSYHTRDSSPPGRRNTHQPARNSWLMLSTHEEGSRYIPQLGDEVVYMRQGHQECIGTIKGRGPWETMKGYIRAAEYCSVISLEYSTHPGSGDDCCKITLQFEDPTSSVFGESFTFTLLEMNGLPDFLVERSRFDAAMARKWAFRDKCQVWWKNEDGTGSWWDGRITSVKAKSSDFPESPWERYVVQYKGSPPEVFSHSPWELHDVESQWEPPCIDDELREKLLSDLDELENSGSDHQDHFGIQKLKQVSQKSEFINRFPVPLTFEIIQSRLENNYYRGLEAMKHDVSVLLSNAESYFSKSRAILAKLRNLSNWFTKKFSSL